MKIKTYESDMLMQLENFMSNEERIVKKVFISPTKRNEDLFYVFYEETGEELNKEKEELSKLENIAIKVEKEEAYALLKNSTQREIYLLQKHSIPSAQGKKVVEIVNMRKILEGERK